jgi:hypothetical protein
MLLHCLSMGNVTYLTRLQFTLVPSSSYDEANLQSMMFHFCKIHTFLFGDVVNLRLVRFFSLYAGHYI